MRRRVVGWTMLSLLQASLVMAQPPRPREEGPPREQPGAHEAGGQREVPGGGRPGPGGGRPGPGGPHPPMPLIDALDKDRDHSISAEELRTATQSLAALDQNGDGKLSPDEFAPRPGQHGGPREGGPRDGGPRPPRGQGFQVPPAFGGPGFPGGPGGHVRDDRPGQRGPDGPDRPPMPSPERFVEHAMEFDADGDKKLDRDELMKFVQSMPAHRPGGMSPSRPDRPHEDGGRDRDRRQDRPREEDRPARPEPE